MDNEKIITTLTDFGLEIQQELQVKKDAGELQVIEFEYVPVKSVDYFSGIYILDWENISIIPQYEWNSYEQRSDFLNQMSRKENCQSSLKMIIEKFTLGEDFKALFLYRFPFELINSALNEFISTERINKYAVKFLKDIERGKRGGEITWKVELFLKGLNLEIDHLN